MQEPSAPWIHRVWPLAAIVVLVMIQQTVTVSQDTQLTRTLSNMLHVPLFAAITLLLVRAVPGWRLACIAAVVAAIALVTEGAQLFNDRHASFSDLGLDAVGMSLALAGSWASQRLRARRRYYVLRPLLWAGVAVLVAGITLAAPLRVGLAYQVRDRIFPVLLEPDTAAATLLVSGNSPVDRRLAPDDWPSRAGQRVLAVTWAEEPYPRFQLDEVGGDWSHYASVVMEVYVPSQYEIPLTAAIGYAGEMVAPGFGRRTARPGPQRLCYDLPTGSAAKGEIQRLVVRSSTRAAGRTVLIGRIELSPSSCSAPGPGVPQLGSNRLLADSPDA